MLLLLLFVFFCIEIPYLLQKFFVDIFVPLNFLSALDGSERHLIKIGKYAAYVAPAKNEKKTEWKNK